MRSIKIKCEVHVCAAISRAAHGRAGDMCMCMCACAHAEISLMCMCACACAQDTMAAGWEDRIVRVVLLPGGGFQARVAAHMHMRFPSVRMCARRTALPPRVRRGERAPPGCF